MTSKTTVLSDEQKTARAIAAVDAMATTWAMTFDLRQAVNAMMRLPNAEDRLMAFVKQGYGEGLFTGRTSHQPAAQPCPGDHQQKPSGHAGCGTIEGDLSTRACPSSTVKDSLMVQKPAAWTLTATLDKRETTTKGYLWFSDPLNYCWTPLYTAPQPAAQPNEIEALKATLAAYEKHGVTCQTYRGFVDAPCAECNSVPAAQSAAIPAGYALVPLEPTPEMLEAYHELIGGLCCAVKRAGAYRAMIAAAPGPV